ncbi:MAG: hypothetical protein RL427_1016 [Bacteroidota bacterium]|jgi:hypothetical protein
MKRILLIPFLTLSLSATSQSVIQSVNSGSIIASSSSVSVGEIVVVPENQVQSSTGIIGILAQTQQPLEVPQLELSEKITVFPNPTTATVYFQTDLRLLEEKVSIFNIAGQLISDIQITADNSLDLSSLSTGTYLIQFHNKNIHSFKIIKH